MSAARRFETVVLDVDSTLSGIEGIDWLAARRGPDVAARVAAMTNDAMCGGVALERVYTERLSLVGPSRAEMERLGEEYIRHGAEGAKEAIAALNAAGVRVVVVSGGILQAILPLARAMGVQSENVRAVRLIFNADGSYAGHDDDLLCTAGGKPDTLRSLRLEGRTLAVGDGSTDLAMRGVADEFCAFTGFVRRESVVSDADYVITNFAELLTIVIAQ